MRVHSALLSSCLISTTIFGQQAFAREAPADVAAAPTDIIVTARRREESIQDVRISVSALSGDQLAKSDVTDVQGPQYRTPSLSITSALFQLPSILPDSHRPDTEFGYFTSMSQAPLVGYLVVASQRPYQRFK